MTSTDVQPLASAAGGIDATEVRVGVSGKLLCAPVGTAGPTDVTTDWPSGWYDLGYLDDDGPSLTPSLSSEDIKAWQSLMPVRKVVTERTLEIKGKLIQENTETLVLAFGGGTWTTTGTDPDLVYQYTPPDPAFIDERAFGLEVQDGTNIDRYVFYRGLVTDVGDIVFKRSEATLYELTISLLMPTSGPWFTLFSNNPANNPTPA
jgi:hypothetical protein